MLGFLEARSYDQLRSSHKGWVKEYLGNVEKARHEEKRTVPFNSPLITLIIPSGQ